MRVVMVREWGGRLGTAQASRELWATLMPTKKAPLSSLSSCHPFPPPDDPQKGVSSPGSVSRGGSGGKAAGSGSMGTAGGSSAAELEADRAKVVL